MHKSFYHDEVFFDNLETDAQNLQVSKDRFMTIFSRFLPTTFNLSQNWSSDNHFKVLNKSKSWLAQKLWHKIKIFLFLFFCVFVKKHLICAVFFAIFAIFAVFLHRNEAFSTKIEIHYQKWPSFRMEEFQIKNCGVKPKIIIHFELVNKGWIIAILCVKAWH